MYIRPLASSVKQGLDLQGGTHVVLQAVDTPQLKVNDDALDRATHIIERRVNALGLTEPVVQRQGRDRIIVELPGVKDPEKAINMLGKTAMLEFKDPNNKTVLTGTDLKDAKAVVGNGNQPLVSMEFSDEGGQKFADVTARNVGKRIAITLDGEVLTAPVVQEAITGGAPRLPATVPWKKHSILPFYCAAVRCRLNWKSSRTGLLARPWGRTPRKPARKRS